MTLTVELGIIGDIPASGTISAPPSKDAVI